MSIRLHSIHLKRLAAVGLAALLLWPATWSGERQDDLYSAAQDALDQRDYREAVRLFEQAAEAGGRRTDGALYWKAHALHSMRRIDEAQRTLDDLASRFPDSRWSSEADSLRAELGRRGGSAGRSRGGEPADCSLKLQALQYLMEREPESAQQRLTRFLKGDCDEGSKRHATFLLVQSGAPQAVELLAEMALDSASRRLAKDAIHTLGIFGSEESAQALDRIYERTSDRKIKEEVLHSYMIQGNTARLLSVARSESDERLRTQAIHQLGVSGAGDKLERIYADEPSATVREAVLQAWMVSGDAERLARVAGQDEDRNLRRKAIQQLGAMGAADKLRGLARTERSEEVQEALLHAFMISGESAPIFDVARNSDSAELRSQAVHWLGVMGERARLLELFQAESNVDLQASICHALFVADASKELIEIARSDVGAQVRAAAVHSLALIGDAETTEALQRMYWSERNGEVKQQILHGFMIQDNATALIEIARREKNRELKMQAVRALGQVDSDQAKQFMLDLLDGGE